MRLVRLTNQNAHNFIGYEILFKTRGEYIVKKIIDANNISIKINHPDLNNQLNMTRKIFVLIE
jgi:hypothetical protein